MQNIALGRKNIKNNIRYVLGDKCAHCGYNSCEAALEIHHLVPEKKKHTFGDLNIGLSWQEVDEEIQDCVLLCANCHREIHNELFEIASSYNAQKSQEIFKLEQEFGIHRCEICGNKVSFGYNRCESCAHKANRVVERPTREELKQAIRNIPFTKIGIKFGVSDNAIRKWCKAENLPYTKKEINSYSNTEWNEL